MRGERSESVREGRLQRLHPVVLRVVFDFGQAENFQGRGHVHAESPAEAVLQSVPPRPTSLCQPFPYPRKSSSSAVRGLLSRTRAPPTSNEPTLSISTVRRLQVTAVMERFKL